MSETSSANHAKVSKEKKRQEKKPVLHDGIRERYSSSWPRTKTCQTVQYLFYRQALVRTNRCHNNWYLCTCMYFAGELCPDSNRSVRSNRTGQRHEPGLVRERENSLDRIYALIKAKGSLLSLSPMSNARLGGETGNRTQTG